ncbi:FadR/GntR family transcriptional regulator [Streptomyces sp. NPDC058424]|uniref:FadR/GntR family transcriptional regulator n=1 Tax=Streptomyces sp. NPDC058424 TaxID=3346491 RepID=UPI0036596122
MPETAAARPSGNRQSAIQLTPMEVPKASDVLAGELRERILTGEFTEGVALPPERELVVQTQMSRATVREALRILEVQGLVRIKTGRAGGAFVQRPGKDSVASSVSLLIRGRQIRLSSLLETREAIEPYCARLAAVHRTADDLAALEAANEAIADENGTLAAFLQANVDWHVAVATASHNELLTGFMTALSRAIYTATENERFVDAEVRRTAVRAHRSITNAIRAQDPDAAVRRMTRHVHSYAKAVLHVDERTEITVSDDE